MYATQISIPEYKVNISIMKCIKIKCVLIHNVSYILISYTRNIAEYKMVKVSMIK